MRGLDLESKPEEHKTTSRESLYNEDLIQILERVCMF